MPYAGAKVAAASEGARDEDEARQGKAITCVAGTIMLFSCVLPIAGCGGSSSSMAPSSSSAASLSGRSSAPEYEVIPSEAASVQYERYECADFSMTIPAGW